MIEELVQRIDVIWDRANVTPPSYSQSAIIGVYVIIFGLGESLRTGTCYVERRIADWVLLQPPACLVRRPARNHICRQDEMVRQ